MAENKSPNHLSLLRNFLLVSTVVSSSVPAGDLSISTLTDLRRQREKTRLEVESALEEWAMRYRLTGKALSRVRHEEVDDLVEEEFKMIKKEVKILEKKLENLKVELEAARSAYISS